MSKGQPVERPDEMTQLIESYGPALLAFFSRRLSDWSEAEDLKQELFAALMRRSDLHSIGNMEGYLFQAAANLLRERARRSSRRPHLVSDEDVGAFHSAADELSPERIMLGRDAYAVFVQGLRELPERQRTIFVLNRFEELTGREIARRLGISTSLVEKDMRRAIASLKDRLS